MKPKKCKNYDKEAGCIGCYGNGDDKCKGYNRECYDYEIRKANESSKKTSCSRSV